MTIDSTEPRQDAAKKANSIYISPQRRSWQAIAARAQAQRIQTRRLREEQQRRQGELMRRAKAKSA